MTYPLELEDAGDYEPAPDEVVVEHVTNHYRCAKHGEWSDDWCCSCDDYCPVCDVAHEPYGSTVQAVYVLKIGKTICPVCDSPHEF